jgi:hypothetical protein
MIEAIRQLFRKSGIEVSGKDEVTSDEGWQLRLTGILPPSWRLEYAEGNKETSAGIECGHGGPRGLIFYVHLSEVHGWKDSQKAFTKEDRDRIATNIRRGMRALKYVCKIE